MCEEKVGGPGNRGAMTVEAPAARRLLTRRLQLLTAGDGGTLGFISDSMEKIPADRGQRIHVVYTFHPRLSTA